MFITIILMIGAN